MSVILRKYATASSITFPLSEPDAHDYVTGLSFSAGDIQISKNEGAFANAGGATSEVGRGWYKLVLSGADLTTARLVVSVIDQTATKVFADQSIYIESYGHASAQIPYDFSQTVAEQLNLDSIWDALSSAHVTDGTFGKILQDLSGSVLAQTFWQYVIEAGAPSNVRTAEKMFRVLMAVTSGKDAGVGDWSALGLDGTTTRATGTLDSDGKRTSVTLDGS